MVLAALSRVCGRQRLPGQAFNGVTFVPGGLAAWSGLAGTRPGFGAAGPVRSEMRVPGSFASSARDFGLASNLMAG